MPGEPWSEELSAGVDAVCYFEREQGVPYHLQKPVAEWVSEKLAQHPGLDVAAEIQAAAEHRFRREVTSAPGTLNNWLKNASQGRPADRLGPPPPAKEEDEWPPANLAYTTVDTETGEIIEYT